MDGFPGGTEGGGPPPHALGGRLEKAGVGVRAPPGANKTREPKARRLPVAVRELRMAAYAPATYRGRMAITGLGIIGTGWALFDLLEFSNRPTSWVGQTLFFIEAWAAFFLAGIGGFTMTADAISQEKREGTL